VLPVQRGTNCRTRAGPTPDNIRTSFRAPFSRFPPPPIAISLLSVPGWSASSLSPSRPRGDPLGWTDSQKSRSGLLQSAGISVVLLCPLETARDAPDPSVSRPLLYQSTQFFALFLSLGPEFRPPLSPETGSLAQRSAPRFRGLPESDTLFFPPAIFY